MNNHEPKKKELQSNVEVHIIGPRPGESIESYLGRMRDEDLLLPPQPFPKWGEGMSALMNALLRSSVFSPLEKGKRDDVKDLSISSQTTYQITFNGPRLDEGDRDVFLYAIRLYSEVPPGALCKITVKSFLEAIRSKSPGQNNRGWLIESLKRLSRVILEIKYSNDNVYGTYSGGIFNLETTNKYKDIASENAGEIYFSIPPNFMGHFLQDYTKIPIFKRLELKGRGSQLAKWLQGYILSHKTPFPVKVETLKNFTDSKTKELKAFRKQIKAALNLLIEDETITFWEIDKDDLIHIIRNKNPQQLYIKDLLELR